MRKIGLRSTEVLFVWIASAMSSLLLACSSQPGSADASAADAATTTIDAPTTHPDAPHAIDAIVSIIDARVDAPLLAADARVAVADAVVAPADATLPDATVPDAAVPDAAVVHDALVEHPDWFARWTHPPYDNGTLCLMPPEAKTGRPGDNCSWEIRAGVYDFSQEVVRDWFLENIVKPVMKVGDGIWLDGDGPDNGAWACSGSYDWKNLKPPYPALNSSETDAFCVGENLVQQAAHEWLIANGGFDAQACFSNIAGSSLPQAADTPAQCAAKLRASDHRPSPLGGPTGYAMDRTGGRDYTDATALQTIAAFMLVRDAHWFFGVTQTSNTINMTVAALLLSDFGAPLDRMSNAGDVFTRHYEKATVTLDCASFTARFTPV